MSVAPPGLYYYPLMPSSTSIPSYCFFIMPKALATSVVQTVVAKLLEGIPCDVIHSETGVSTGMISKIRSSHCPDLPRNLGGCPPKLSLTKICHASCLLTGPMPTTPRLVVRSYPTQLGYLSLTVLSIIGHREMV
jgi:hypothetical protein